MLSKKNVSKYRLKKYLKGVERKMYHQFSTEQNFTNNHGIENISFSENFEYLLSGKTSQLTLRLLGRCAEITAVSKATITIIFISLILSMSREISIDTCSFSTSFKERKHLQ